MSSQGESELVAKDDNLDAADPNKEKKSQDKEEQMDVEEKEKIHEQGDEVAPRVINLFYFSSLSSRIIIRYLQHSANLL